MDREECRGISLTTLILTDHRVIAEEGNKSSFSTIAQPQLQKHSPTQEWRLRAHQMIADREESKLVDISLQERYDLALTDCVRKVGKSNSSPPLIFASSSADPFGPSKKTFFEMMKAGAEYQEEQTGENVRGKLGYWYHHVLKNELQSNRAFRMIIPICQEPVSGSLFAPKIISLSLHPSWSCSDETILLGI